jgi:hypothetical protein
VIEVGQTYPATLAVTDAQGAPANPVTATLALTLPDGSVLTPTVTLPPATLGLLEYDYVTTQPGLHKAAWQTTGPGTAGSDYFNVREYIALMSVAEARAHLNMTKPSKDGDAELRRFIQGATELIESKIGVCVRRSFTDRVTEGDWQMVLPRRPVLSVTSITSVWPGGPVWHTADLIVDGEAGIAQPQMPLFPFWWGPWDVVTVCGRAEIPERFIHAAKEQLRHLWDTQRGAQAPKVLAGEEIFSSTAGWSFSVPRRVLEMIEEDMVPPV